MGNQKNVGWKYRISGLKMQDQKVTIYVDYATEQGEGTPHPVFGMDVCSCVTKTHPYR